MKDLWLPDGAWLRRDLRRLHIESFVRQWPPCRLPDDYDESLDSPEARTLPPPHGYSTARTAIPGSESQSQSQYSDEYARRYSLSTISEETSSQLAAAVAQSPYTGGQHHTVSDAEPGNSHSMYQEDVEPSSPNVRMSEQMYSEVVEDIMLDSASYYHQHNHHQDKHHQEASNTPWSCVATNGSGPGSGSGSGSGSPRIKRERSHSPDDDNNGISSNFSSDDLADVPMNGISIPITKTTTLVTNPVVYRPPYVTAIDQETGEEIVIDESDADVFMTDL